jgi:hypothetical protein
MNNHMPIELTLFYNFIEFEDTICLSNTNKYFNDFCKKYIEYYSKKLKKTKHIINKINIKAYNYHDFVSYYSEKYWYTLFNTNLDSYQLSLYYSYFISDYYKKKCYYKNEKYVKDNHFKNDNDNNVSQNCSDNYKKYYYEYYTWKCFSYPDGYIKKTTPNNDSYFDSLTNNYSSEIIITFTLYFKVFIYEFNSSIDCVNKLYDIDIDYNYNYKTNKYIYINKKLLKYNLSKYDLLSY